MEAALHDFFSVKANFKTLHKLVTQRYMSLRQYECLVMHLPFFAPRLDTIVAYERFLTYYGKRNFDCFIRGNFFRYKKFQLEVITNIPQLRFFYFFIKKKLHKFVFEKENKLRVKNLLKKIDATRRKLRGDNTGSALRHPRLCMRNKRRVTTLLHVPALKKHSLHKRHRIWHEVSKLADAAVTLTSHVLPEIKKVVGK